MILCHTMNDRLKFTPIHFFLPLLSIFFLFYFLYHILEGDRGLSALIRVQNELSTVQNELTEAKVLQKKLERRNSLLFSSSLDTDMLDEQVKRLLVMVRPNEYQVIP